jgi:hypothetical protein
MVKHGARLGTLLLLLLGSASLGGCGALVAGAAGGAAVGYVVHEHNKDVEQGKKW